MSGLIAEADPLLDQHVVGRGVIDLSGVLYPGSIRDQILRAFMVTDALARHGSLHPGSNILVIGASVAGIASVFRALDYGARVVLVDANPGPCFVLRQNKSRLVSPSLYDWPSAHWVEQEYSGKYLDYKEDIAGNVVERWITELLNRQGDPTFHWEPDLLCKSFNQDGPPFTFTFVRPQLVTREIPLRLASAEFDLVFNCKGRSQPSENSLVWHRPPRANGAFPMFRFWTDDPFPLAGRSMQVPPALPDATTGTRVLIVGAGDGGLQDFIRFVTGGQSPREIIVRISRSLRNDASAVRTLYKLLDSENTFARHTAFSPDSASRTSHIAHQETVREIELLYKSLELRGEGRYERLTKTLDELVCFDDIQLISHHEFFGRCYSTNRFLALLLSRFIENKKQAGSVIQYETRATTVECVDDHDVESLRPEDHHMGQHRVTLEKADGSTELRLCRTVIPRIGVSDRKDRRLVQMLPYWLPDWGPQSQLKVKLPAKIRPLPDLTNEHTCRQLLWRSLPAIAAIKNHTGVVLCINSNYARDFNCPPERIWGSRAHDYMAKPDADFVERDDALVRKTRRPKCGFSPVGGQRHFIFRFLHPIEMFDPGTAILGNYFQNSLHSHWDGQFILNDERLRQPSVLELERFFEWAPCSIGLTDIYGRFRYANLTLRKVFSPEGANPLPCADIVGLTRSEILHRLGTSFQEPLQSEVREREILNEARQQVAAVDEASVRTQTWYCDRESGVGADRQVNGFPVYALDGSVCGIGSIGFPADEFEVAGLPTSAATAG